MFFFKLRGWWQFSIIGVLSAILYLPIIGNSLVSDDFIVIKRVCVDGMLNTDGFFRPLSDISIWLTCKLGVQQAWPFYITGILVHAITTLLLIWLCVRWRWSLCDKTQQRFALIAGALFFVYPFHNESVAWILGRGALMASTLGITGLLVLVSPGNDGFKRLAVCLCYFAGLAFYETIVVLPVMIFIYLVLSGSSVRSMLKWAVALGLTLVLYILLRINVSGTLAGNYGEGFFDVKWSGFAINALKAIGRTFLPPTDNSGMLMGASFTILLIVIGVTVYLHRQLKKETRSLVFLYMQISFFLVAMLIPAIGGVSTRTSESDRLLHFPSYFLCIIAAFVLINIVHKQKWLMLSLFLLITVCVYFLELNNLNWRKASAAVREVISIIKNSQEQKVYVANLPEEINGAFVFRAGFREALMINGIDTATVVVISKLTRDKVIKYPSAIVYQDDVYQAPPENTMLVYWDKKHWRVIHHK